MRLRQLLIGLKIKRQRLVFYLFYWSIYDLGFEIDLDALDFTDKPDKVIEVLMQLKSQVI
jgi:hypothetical protein